MWLSPSGSLIASGESTAYARVLSGQTSKAASRKTKAGQTRAKNRFVISTQVKKQKSPRKPAPKHNAIWRVEALGNEKGSRLPGKPGSAGGDNGHSSRRRAFFHFGTCTQYLRSKPMTRALIFTSCP